jgi:hypothetical protein
MLIRVSNPPHRDLPIEWRTETGEFISQPIPDQPLTDEAPVDQAPVGPVGWGQPTPPPAWAQPSIAVASHLPPAPFGQPAAGPATWGQPGPGQSADEHPGPSEPASADDVLAIQVAPDEHRAAVRVRMVVLLIVLAAVGTTWAMGGLAKDPGYHPDSGIQSVAVGETVNTGPFRMSVDAAAVFNEYAKLRPFEDDNGSILVVKLTMENLTDASIGTSLYAVSIEGFAGLRAPEAIQIVLDRDGSPAHYLHPALPERVVYAWELNPGTDPPAEVKVILHGATWRNFQGFAFLNEPQWMDHGPRAEAVVPVEDRRAGR